jgi:two-component system phosphate regulon response regulator OmpR
MTKPKSSKCCATISAARASAHPGRVLSREHILNLTQQRDWDPFDRSMDIRVTRLRKKIEPNPDKPRFIKTVRGAGYRFVPDGEG